MNPLANSFLSYSTFRGWSLTSNAWILQKPYVFGEGLLPCLCVHKWLHEEFFCFDGWNVLTTLQMQILGFRQMEPNSQLVFIFPLIQTRQRGTGCFRSLFLSFRVFFGLFTISLGSKTCLSWEFNVLKCDKNSHLNVFWVLTVRCATAPCQAVDRLMLTGTFWVGIWDGSSISFFLSLNSSDSGREITFFSPQCAGGCWSVIRFSRRIHHHYTHLSSDNANELFVFSFRESQANSVRQAWEMRILESQNGLSWKRP